jgi:2-keto-4-pentenoate hydratase/2-oxohepta-3-ene-1,7-dioic acid hydratase in catechol pathway
VRLARYESEEGAQDAVLAGDRLVPIARLGVDARTLVDVLGLDATARRTLAARADEIASSGEGDLVAEVRLLAPIARPPKFLAMAFNSDHDPADLLEKPDLPEAFRRRLHVVVATNRAYPAADVPVVFNKQTSSITGPGADVWAPSDAQHLDYEGELVVVIARRARRLTPSQAVDAIGGYTAGNDVSVREWQFDTPTLWMGKSLETFGPIGPVVVTPDEIDGDAVAIRTWVNDELRQDGSTAERRFKVAEIVSWISQRCTLEPGDLIATGTGGGLGQFTGRYMKAGDVVTVEVEGIGRLENHVVPEPVTAA